MIAAKAIALAATLIAISRAFSDQIASYPAAVK